MDCLFINGIEVLFTPTMQKELCHLFIQSTYTMAKECDDRNKAAMPSMDDDDPFWLPKVLKLLTQIPSLYLTNNITSFPSLSYSSLH